MTDPFLGNLRQSTLGGKEPEVYPDLKLDFNQVVVGHDFTVTDSFLTETNETYKTFLEKFSEFFSKDYIILLVVGYDSEYLGEKNQLGNHYHFRFISDKDQKQVTKRKEKFVEKHKYNNKKGFKHSVCNTGILRDIDEVYCYLAYALKEKIILCPDSLEKTPHSVCLGEHLAKHLAIKKANVNYEKKTLAKKQEKKKDKDLALDYLMEYGPQYFGMNEVNIIAIHTLLVQYQRKQKLYLNNFQMTTIAHTYLQQHTDIDDEKIAFMRFNPYSRN